MKTIPIDKQMLEIAERDLKEVFGNFVKKHIEKHKQEQSKKRQQDISTPSVEGQEKCSLSSHEPQRNR